MALKEVPRASLAMTTVMWEYGVLKNLQFSERR
jgi:hypothetical protein